MFKIVDFDKLTDMGFIKDGFDYVYKTNIDGSLVKIFTVYAGSPYLRYSKTSYVSHQQLYCIYKWTMEKLIEWED